MIRLFTPHEALKPFIQHYVYSEFGETGRWNHASMAPPGYNALTIILEKDTYQIRVDDEETQRYPSPVFTGQITICSQVRLYDKLKVFFVVFHPCGAFRLLGIPQHECTGKSFHLSDLLGTAGKYMGEELIHQSDPLAVRQLLDRFFMQRLVTQRDPYHLKQLCYITEQIQNYSHDSEMIDRICDQHGYSQGKLERHMKTAVGMGPKKFQRIMRFNKSFAYIKNQPSECKWSQVACRFGYYDQAHFIKEFKHFLGQTPGTFKKENWLMKLLRP